MKISEEHWWRVTGIMWRLKWNGIAVYKVTMGQQEWLLWNGMEFTYTGRKVKWRIFLSQIPKIYKKILQVKGLVLRFWIHQRKAKRSWKQFLSGIDSIPDCRNLLSESMDFCLKSVWFHVSTYESNSILQNQFVM